MKRGGLVIFLVALFHVSVVFGAPIVSLEDAIVSSGDTSVDIDLWINTDDTSPVDSATFTDSEIAGFSLTSVSIVPRTGWSTTVLLPKFGSTDIVCPPSPITSGTLFATLTYTFAADFFQPGDEVDIAFSFFELADDIAVVYSGVSVIGGNISAIPIPATVLLLGSGFVGLVCLRRKRAT